MRNAFRVIVAAALLYCLLAPGVVAGGSDSGVEEPISHLRLLKKVRQNQGKIVVVNFFASWCDACKKEMPHFLDLRREYPDNELVILGVSVDENKKDYKNYVDSVSFNYPTYLAEEGVGQMFQVRLIPKTLVYTRQGKLAHSPDKHITVAKIREMLPGIMGE